MTGMEDGYDYVELINQILSPTSFEFISAEKLSKEFDLELEKSEKLLKQLEKMGLVESFFQPTDFAKELVNLEVNNSSKSQTP
uniref:Uncharacterized protein n=1 Tax=uncultured organism TaxID=155900 RepID=M1P1X9_9ZZZZ|nr:hypothetical protein FLSS-25_0002 [uncultured organism]